MVMLTDASALQHTPMSYVADNFLHALQCEVTGVETLAVATPEVAVNILGAKPDRLQPGQWQWRTRVCGNDVRVWATPPAS